MGLTGKILLFIAALVVLLVGGTLAFTTVQADRLARATIDAGLQGDARRLADDPGRPLQQAEARRARARERPLLQGGARRARPGHDPRLAGRARARTWPPTS